MVIGDSEIAAPWKKIRNVAMALKPG